MVPGRSICPKQPLSQCCCRPLVREAQLLLESSTVQKKKKEKREREGARAPSLRPFLRPLRALHLFAPKTPRQEDETTQRAQPLCSQPARLQFQTSLDHFSCSPEMNNAHINWRQLINFHLTALYLFFSNKGLAAWFCFTKQPERAPAGNYSSALF